MNHPFILSGVPDICVKCRRPELDHTSLASCEGCLYVGVCDLYKGTFLLCPECFEKEETFKTLSDDYQSPAKQDERVAKARLVAERTIAMSREIDSSILNRGDYFNAETKSITELKEVIDADPTVERKDYQLYMVVKERFDKFSEKLIKVDEERLEVVSQIKASQIYLNNLVSSLTKEEQEKYRIRDINYKPIDKVVKPKAEGSNKINMTELKELSEEHKIPIEILKNICNAMKLTPLKAVVRYKEMLSTVNG